MAPAKPRRFAFFTPVMVGGALFAAGCDRHDAPGVTRRDRIPAVSQAPSATNQAASDFIGKAVGDDLYEYQAAGIAAVRAHDPAVRTLAAATAKASLASRTELVQSVAVSGQRVTIPSKLTDHLQSMLDQLHRGTARDFDKTYIEQQIEADEDALSLMSAYARSGGAPSIEAAAAALAPARQDRLDKARSIQDELNKEP